MAFFDPAVQFGFQFEPIETEAATGGTDEKAPEKAAAIPAKVESEPPPAPQAAKEPQTGGGEVVSLDRFRKK